MNCDLHFPDVWYLPSPTLNHEVLHKARNLCHENHHKRARKENDVDEKGRERR